MIVQYALATLVVQEVLTATLTKVYTPLNTIELTRIALSNTTESGGNPATIYHLPKASTGSTPANEHIVGSYMVPASSQLLETSDSPNSSITLQEGDELWAIGVGVVLSAYGVPRNVAPIPRV